MKPQISIVIPTFNRGHLIGRAIRSVISQHFTNWELIVVDDGSTDNTPEVMASFMTDRRIQYIRKDNSGAADTRNVGARRAVGLFVTFLDSDDEAVPQWLEKMLEVMINKDAKVICCGLIKFDHTGKKKEVVMPENLGILYHNKVGRFLGGAFILERDLFWKIGGYDKDFHSDQHSEFAMRLIPYLVRERIEIFNIFEPLIHVHLHAGLRIRTDKKAKFYGARRVLQKHYDLLARDRNMLFNYLSIAGVNGIESGHRKEGIGYLFRALKVKPWSIKAWGRLIKNTFLGLN